MFGKTLIASVVGFAALAAAQGNSTTPPPPQQSGDTLVHAVWVGNPNGDLVFTPETINAKVGEMVQFQFYPRNHSVARSTFDNPCAPVGGANGFFSSFMPVDAASDEQPVFTIEVKDENPIWFYCGTGNHCQQGMVGVINPPANNNDRTVEKFKEAAAASDKTVVPINPNGGEDEDEDTTDSPDETTESTPGSTDAPSSSSTIRASLAGLFVAAAMGAFLL